MPHNLFGGIGASYGPHLHEIVLDLSDDHIWQAYLTIIGETMDGDTPLIRSLYDPAFEGTRPDIGL
jgi:hypothetical protein